MKEVVINETDIVSAANEGMDSFLSLFVKSIKDSIGGELTTETMPMLNVNQITLLAYDIFHEEVMDGGFVQLIHNGYGGFIFQNPFAKVFIMEKNCILSIRINWKKIVAMKNSWLCLNNSRNLMTWMMIL